MDFLLFKLSKIIGVLFIIFLVSFHLYGALKDNKKSQSDKILLTIIFGVMILGSIYFLIFDLLCELFEFMPVYLNLPAKYVLFDLTGIVFLLSCILMLYTNNKDKKDLYSKIVSISFILMAILFFII